MYSTKQGEQAQVWFRIGKVQCYVCLGLNQSSFWKTGGDFFNLHFGKAITIHCPNIAFIK